MLGLYYLVQLTLDCVANVFTSLGPLNVIRNVLNGIVYSSFFLCISKWLQLFPG